MDAYLTDPAPDAPPPLGDSMAAARAAFGAMKAKLLDGQAAGGLSKEQDDQLDALRAQVSALVSHGADNTAVSQSNMQAGHRCGSVTRRSASWWPCSGSGILAQTGTCWRCQILPRTHKQACALDAMRQC